MVNWLDSCHSERIHICQLHFPTPRVEGANVGSPISCFCGHHSQYYGMEPSGEIKGWYQSVDIRHNHDLGSADEHRWICKGILQQNQVVIETQCTYKGGKEKADGQKWLTLFCCLCTAILGTSLDSSLDPSAHNSWHQHGKLYPFSSTYSSVPTVLLQSGNGREHTKVRILMLHSVHDYLDVLQ